MGSDHAPNAAQALAGVLATSERRKRQAVSEVHVRRGDFPEVVTAVTTPIEWECQHEWMLRLGGWWGLLEAYCAKCGEVAERRAA